MGKEVEPLALFIRSLAGFSKSFFGFLLSPIAGERGFRGEDKRRFQASFQALSHGSLSFWFSAVSSYSHRLRDGTPNARVRAHVIIKEARKGNAWAHAPFVKGAGRGA
jgi:hypothetical protein